MSAQHDDSDDEIQLPDDGPKLHCDGPGEFRCPECGARCTKGPSGTEYGHRKRPRCPRRPESVDPADRTATRGDRGMPHRGDDDE